MTNTTDQINHILDPQFGKFYLYQNFATTTSILKNTTPIIEREHDSNVTLSLKTHLFKPV